MRAILRVGVLFMLASQQAEKLFTTSASGKTVGSCVPSFFCFVLRAYSGTRSKGCVLNKSYSFLVTCRGAPSILEVAYFEYNSCVKRVLKVDTVGPGQDRVVVEGKNVADLFVCRVDRSRWPQMRVTSPLSCRSLVYLISARDNPRLVISVWRGLHK